MIAEQLLTPEAATILTERFVQLMESYSEEIADRFTLMIDEWESAMSEDDKTLYSLGLRRARDIVTESNPTEILHE